MNNIVKIKKTIKRIYGRRFNVEYLIQSLPRCVTQELTINMNLAAKYFDENNLEPTANHPKVKQIIEKFGHRGNIEMDLGSLKWADDPASH